MSSKEAIDTITELWPEATLIAGKQAVTSTYPWDESTQEITTSEQTDSHRDLQCVRCGENFSVPNAKTRSRAFSRCRLCEPSAFWGLK